MTQYLYRVRPARAGFLAAPTAEESARVSEHFAYLKDLARRGTVLLAGRTQNEDETTFGIVLFEADTMDQAEAIMHQDPAVRSGVFQAELFPYEIALVSPRLAERALRLDAGGVAAPPSRA
jgi:uncharacterized protein YciI